MQFVKASAENAEKIFDLVQETIAAIYPKYYPQGVVEFYSQLHCIKKIEEDIAKGYVWALIENGQIIGTGGCREQHINRVFVSPQLQGRGYGSFIMQCLEDIIATKYDTVTLNASLTAGGLYESRGYKTTKREKLVVQNGDVLIYESMEKKLVKLGALGTP